MAYSIDDDKWGTARSVDAMMRVYPNLEHRHLVPAEHELQHIGHFGFFRSSSSVLWSEVLNWFGRRLDEMA